MYNETHGLTAQQGIPAQATERDFGQELTSLLSQKNDAAKEYKKVYMDYMSKKEHLKMIQANIEGLDKQIQETAPRFEEYTRVEFI